MWTFNFLVKWVKLESDLIRNKWEDVKGGKKTIARQLEMKEEWSLKERERDPKQAAARMGSQTWEPLCLGREKRLGVRSKMGGQGYGGGGESK